MDMIGLAYDRAKGFVLDKIKVVKAKEEAEKKLLGLQGGRLAKTIKRSMKQAPKKKPVAIQGKQKKQRKNARPPVSPPGKPPYTHTKYLKNLILYAVDADSHSVVVGPIKRKAKYDNIPGILEFGGTESQTRKRKFGGTQTKNVNIQPRPYMKPGLEAITPTLPSMWSGAISK